MGQNGDRPLLKRAFLEVSDLRTGDVAICTCALLTIYVIMNSRLQQ